MSRVALFQDSYSIPGYRFGSNQQIQRTLNYMFPLFLIFLKLVLILLFINSGVSSAEPYTPASPDEIIITLKSRLDIAGLRDIQKKMIAAPRTDPESAAVIAERFISLGKKTEDPRLFGYAQSILSTWRFDTNPPLSILIQRVKIYQFFHDFDSALNDIYKILFIEANNTQMLLNASLILQDMGRLKEAQEYCDRIAHSSYTLWSLCAADLASVTGKSREGYALLENTLSQLGSKNEKVWALDLMAQIAWRRGELSLAESNFNKALSIIPEDTYTLKSFLTYLYTNNRVNKMLDLLSINGSYPSEDGVFYFQYCLVKKLKGDLDLEHCTETLSSKYENAKSRGDSPHYAEEILFYLDLENQPELALNLAKENWLKNKKPYDAVLLARSAYAVNDKATLSSLSTWVNDTHLEDVILGNYLKPKL